MQWINTATDLHVTCGSTQLPGNDAFVTLGSGTWLCSTCRSRLSKEAHTTGCGFHFIALTWLGNEQPLPKNKAT